MSFIVKMHYLQKDCAFNMLINTNTFINNNVNYNIIITTKLKNTTSKTS